MRSFTLLTVLPVVVLAGLYDYMPSGFFNPGMTRKDISDLEKYLKENPDDEDAKKELKQLKANWWSIINAQTQYITEMREEEAKEVKKTEKAESKSVFRHLFNRRNK